MGAMAAPAMMMLTQLPAAASVPFFVWGPVTVADALLLWLLPDTLGTSIPDTMQVQFDCEFLSEARLPQQCCQPMLWQHMRCADCTLCGLMHAVDLVRSGYRLYTGTPQL